MWQSKTELEIGGVGLMEERVKGIYEIIDEGRLLVLGFYFPHMLIFFTEMHF